MLCGARIIIRIVLVQHATLSNNLLAHATSVAGLLIPPLQLVRACAQCGPDLRDLSIAYTRRSTNVYSISWKMFTISAVGRAVVCTMISDEGEHSSWTKYSPVASRYTTQSFMARRASAHEKAAGAVKVDVIPRLVSQVRCRIQSSTRLMGETG